jgi:hypothetical protein
MRKYFFIIFIFTFNLAFANLGEKRSDEFFTLEEERASLDMKVETLPENQNMTEEIVEIQSIENHDDKRPVKVRGMEENEAYWETLNSKKVNERYE